MVSVPITKPGRMQAERTMPGSRDAAGQIARRFLEVFETIHVASASNSLPGASK
jgi:hypothetical protein